MHRFQVEFAYAIGVLNNITPGIGSHYGGRINKSTAVFYGLYSHRPENDVKKCSKLKWNHEPQASGFTAKFWTFNGVILWSIRV